MDVAGLDYAGCTGKGVRRCLQPAEPLHQAGVPTSPGGRAENAADAGRIGRGMSKRANRQSEKQNSFRASIGEKTPRGAKSTLTVLGKKMWACGSSFIMRLGRERQGAPQDRWPRIFTLKNSTNGDDVAGRVVHTAPQIKKRVRRTIGFGGKGSSIEF